MSLHAQPTAENPTNPEETTTQCQHHQLPHCHPHLRPPLPRPRLAAPARSERIQTRNPDRQSHRLQRRHLGKTHSQHLHQKQPRSPLLTHQPHHRGSDYLRGCPPVIFTDSPEPNFNTGIADDFGQGFSDGPGPGGHQPNIPDRSRKRCSAGDRLARLTQNGGTPECEEAVMNGLRWLKGKPIQGWLMGRQTKKLP